MKETFNKYRRYWVPGGLLVLVLLLPLVNWLAAPLLRNDVVDEPFPFSLPDARTVEGLSPDEAAAVLDGLLSAAADEAMMAELSETQLETLEETMMEVAGRMDDSVAADAMPDGTADWQVIAAGTFSGADAFHQGSGRATVYARGAERILRLEEFMVTNGPDLHVLLVENVAGSDQDSIGDYVDLGPLKGNVGDQNYEIPADVDLSRYSGVMIYCQPFHVVFATADL